MNFLILKLRLFPLLLLCIPAYMNRTVPPETVQCAQSRESYTVAQHLTYHLILHDYLRKLYKLSKATNLLSGVSKKNEIIDSDNLLWCSGLYTLQNRQETD